MAPYWFKKLPLLIDRRENSGGRVQQGNHLNKKVK
jgi:hypothetical protein